MHSNAFNSAIGGGDRLRSIPETAEVLGLGVATLRRMIASGKGPAVTHLSARRRGIRDSHLQIWINAQAKVASTHDA